MLQIIQSRDTKDLVYNAIIFAIYVVVLIVVLQFLWNKALVKYVTVLKPIYSLKDMLMVAIALAMLKI